MASSPLIYLNNLLLSLLLSLSLFLIQCSSQNPNTDIGDCSEIQLRNANLHPALNGYYQRTQETYNNMPVFEGRANNKIRYIWWNQYDTFTRWSIGSDKFSSSIEGFMDNQLNNAWLLGTGRSWHVVNQQEWVIDQDLNVICSRQLNNNNNNNNNNDNNANSNGGSKPPPPRGGSKPPPRRNERQQQQQIPKVVRVTGARNNLLNQVYYPFNQQYDGFPVYKTDGGEKDIYIFHYSYDNMQRWYIGYTLGSDYDVVSFIEDISKDLSKDGSTQIWSEHSSNDGQWNDNQQFKLNFQENTFANNADARQPPPNYDGQKNDNNRQRNEQANEQQGTGPPRKEDNRRQNVRDNRRDNQNRQRNNDRRQQQQQQQQQDKAQQAYKQDKNTAEQERDERRRQMFRRVNKLDLDVESSGKFESGIDVSSEPDIIITGSDDNDINTVYFVQPVKYNEKNVYKSQSGSYLYFVRYLESDSARWQIGQPNGGVKNDQPIAFVNADTEYPYDIATWQAWLVFDKSEHDWVRQSKVNTYRGDCIINIKGAFNTEINGEWGILPVTHQTRPIFEKMTGNNQRMNIFFNDGEAQYSKWYISNAGGRYLDPTDIYAFIPSSALTVDGVSDFEAWQENQNGKLVENNQLKVTGTCSKVKEHDWKRRRRQRAEERKRRKAMDAAKQQHCPQDMTVSTDPGSNSAVVHWQAYNRDTVEGSDNDEYDVVYSDASVAPGSQFRLGRTAVTYQLKDKQGQEIAKCDFIITVKDEEAPQIQCPGDIYIMTQYNKDKASVKWIQPEVFDNSGQEVQLQQIGGPKQGETLRVGNYMISYQAKDFFQNVNVCNFGLYVVDRQAPKIQNCPQSIQIAVYKDQNYAAFPEWDVPTAWDNVDGNNVAINLIQGVPPGSKLSIPPGNQNEISTQITYEAVDSSDNAARCSFEVKLFRDDSQSEQNKKHQEYHQKIKDTQTIEQSQKEYQDDINTNQEQQDEEWSEKARRLREERELQNKQKRAKAANVGKNRGHRSKVHEQHVRSETHDFEESLRLEDQLRDETNDEAASIDTGDSNNKKSKQKPMTRAERRKKRREDRERRRKARAEKRKKSGKSGGGSSNPISLIFWSTMNFFWALLRPWVWPLWLSIPFLVICCIGMGVGIFYVYSEVSDASRGRGRRVPKYNSWSYKLSGMFNKKTLKQRV